jgi:hypothetical protein
MIHVQMKCAANGEMWNRKNGVGVIGAATVMNSW